MKHTPALDTDQLDRLIELVAEHRAAVYSGEVSGYGQSQYDELVDLDQLTADLRTAR